MRKSFNDDDGAEDDDEVEQRRREYLRRHREMLLQKQRLETERRLQEQERDKTKIQKRLEDIQRAKQKDALVGLHHAATHPLGSTAMREQTASQQTRLPGIYSRIDDLSAGTLRVIAEQQSLRDMTPLNTRGKYHARYMEHPYPIAGAQLKIEKERELCIAAKKLLLTNAISANLHTRAIWC